MTQKITKKKEKQDSKSLNTKLAFATGYVKPPRGIRAKQLKVIIRTFLMVDENDFRMEHIMIYEINDSMYIFPVLQISMSDIQRVN